jgi:PiT family inorganic phosphate transporter
MACKGRRHPRHFEYGSFRRLPQETVQNMRNDMYLASEATRRISKEPSVRLQTDDADVLKLYRSELDGATRFIPLW